MARPVGALVALPMVLPPSVLGVLSAGGAGAEQATGGRRCRPSGCPPCPFTFAGLVVASVFYSLPFMVQPILSSMQALGERPLEVAASLRASPLGHVFQGGAGAVPAGHRHRLHHELLPTRWASSAWC